MKKRDRVCPYHKKEGGNNICDLSGRKCFCDANEWYCEAEKRWDKAEFDKFVEENDG